MSSGTPDQNSDAILEVAEFCKTWPGGTVAARNVSFSARAGELIAIVGESGSGKTTTIKAINRLIEPDSGDLRFQGQPVADVAGPELRRHIGWVMQGDGLFPHMTATENIAVTPTLLGWDKNLIAERVRELLALVRLDPDEHADRFPDQLSGGQRQRVAIARALAAEPPLLLLDEAFGALDPVTRHELHADFQELQARLGFAAVLVTHDMAEALLLATRILVMKDGEVQQMGPPEDLLNHPANDYVKELLAAPSRQAKQIAALEAHNA